MGSMDKKSTIPEIKDLLKELYDLINWCKQDHYKQSWRFTNKIFSKEFLDEKMLEGEENEESAKEVKQINEIVESFMIDIKKVIPH